LLDALDDQLSSLPRKTGHSRARFYRLFQALSAESPGAMRRRLLLERSAWQLRATPRTATEIGLDAGYDSLEAYTRAFKRAYGVSPSIFRRTGAWRIHLPAPNSFHYAGPQKGANNMDLFDLFSGTDSWYTRKLLDHAATLTDEQLDQPVPSNARVFGWEQPDQNVREILERLVITTEVWAAALLGKPMPPMENVPLELRTPQALRERFERVDCDFRKALSEVRDRGAWDETWVDALCEPPETFTFGGMFAHIITQNTQRRLHALDAFHRIGAPMSGMGDPMEWEAEQRRPV
jgi:AraC-like DNA-binding protein/uncharacterized damage-inducible protein DinB